MLSPDDTLNRDKIYQSLFLGHRQIRLLTIQPGDFSEQIQCSLALADWHHTLKYEALSYAWESSSIRQKIRLNGRIVLVTQNLKHALLYLRHSNTSRVLWVDALCINQNCIFEKNHQVKLMDRIYSQSEVVNIWLGEEIQESDRLDEPSFLRGAFSFEKEDTRVCIEIKHPRGGGKPCKQYFRVFARPELDDPSQRMVFHPPYDDLNAGIPKRSPRPFTLQTFWR